MAKDVDLVIRARNEASKAFETLNTVLGVFTDKTEAVSKAASKTDDVLGALKKEVGELGKQLTGLSSLGTIATNLDKARGAVDKLDASVTKGSADLGKLKRVSDDLVASTDRLRSAAGATATMLERQKAAVSATTEQLRAETAEVRNLESALDRLSRKSPAATQARSSLERQSSDRLPTGGNIRNELPGSTAQESARAILEGQLSQARSRVASTQAGLQAQTGIQARIAEDLDIYNAKLRATGAQQRAIDSTIESTANALTREQVALAKAKAGLAETEETAIRASQALGGMVVSADAVAAASARLSASQAQAKARIETLAAAKPDAPVTTSAPLAARAKANARSEYEAASAEAQRLARAMRDAEQPTDELAAAFGRATAQARLAKQAYLEQAEALQKIRGNSFAAFSKGIDARSAAPPVDVASTAAAIAPIKALGTEARAVGDALGTAGAGGGSFRDALKGIYGDSRESLSLMQRLRGEVLGLAAAYVGLQAAIGGVSRVLDTYRTLEAVQNRLGAVFNQDTQRVGQEVNYLQREAARLGVSFGVLADEYGKFNIAAKAANVESQDTRRIFMSVAEAGRVNKLSNDQLSGVFLALTQMMSKGKVQSEELRRQLGDRLPGAFSIMAKAIGVTEAQLDSLMQEGKVLANSETMLSFANELDKRFGSQLSTALKSTTTEIGRFQNSLEQAMLTVAQGGLIDGFTNMLRTLNAYFASDEGRKFFMSLGSAAGTFFNALAAIIPYANELKIAFGAFIAIKIAGALTSLGAVLLTNVQQLRAATGATTTLTGSQRVLAASTAALQVELTKAQIGLEMMSVTGGIAGARFAVLSAAVGVFGRVAALAGTAARGLLAAFGGIPGLIVTGLTVAAGAWLTSVDKTTEALGEHKGLIDAVVSKYEDVKNRTADWAKEIKNVSQTELTVQIDKATKAYEKSISALQSPQVLVPSLFGGSVQGHNADLDKVVEKFKQGKISAADFRDEVDKIAQADPALDKTVIAQLIKSAQEADDMKTSIEKLKAALALMKGEATDAQKKLLGLGEALKDNGAPKATADMKAFGEALDALKAKIPALAVELKKLKDSTENLDALEKAVQAAAGNPELIKKAYDLYDRANASVLDQETQGYLKQYGGDKIPLSLAKTIYGGESYRGQAYPDVGGVPTIGFGSTRVNGKPVQLGDSITKEDAVKQMVADLSKFAAMVDAAIGGVQINENQRNALISYVYNTGSTDGNAKTRAIFDAVKQRKSDEDISNLIAGGVNTVNGVPNNGLTNRRAAEAKLYLRPVDRSTGTADGPTDYDISKQKMDAQNAFDKATKDQVDKSNRNAADQKKINDADNQSAAKREVAIQNALIEAQNRAREQGVVLTKEQVDAIKSSTAAEYDQLHVNDQAKEAEEKVNALYKLRQQLLEELKVAQEQGDQTQVTATRNSIEKANEQLREAIRLAIQYWQAIGGPEADTAIAKLKLQEAQTERNKTAILTAGKANDMLASGMVRGFSEAADNIGKAIAGTESWGDAMRGVGQAFMQFAADFLREIAQMILKQLLLNALSSAMGMGNVGGGVAGFVNSLVGGGPAGALAAVAHTGGLVGSTGVSGNANRLVNPAWFENAARYHNGGIAGLQPGEVPTILKEQEEVLTRNDPRHMLNGGGRGGGGGGPTSIKSVLVMDPNLVPDAMSSSSGEQVVMAHIKSNRATIRSILDKG